MERWDLLAQIARRVAEITDEYMGSVKDESVREWLQSLNAIGRRASVESLDFELCRRAIYDQKNVGVQTFAIPTLGTLCRRAQASQQTELRSSALHALRGLMGIISGGGYDARVVVASYTALCMYFDEFDLASAMYETGTEDAVDKIDWVFLETARTALDRVDPWD
jgi:hypothetical protein